MVLNVHFPISWSSKLCQNYTLKNSTASKCLDFNSHHCLMAYKNRNRGYHNIHCENFTKSQDNSITGSIQKNLYPDQYWDT